MTGSGVSQGREKKYTRETEGPVQVKPWRLPGIEKRGKTDEEHRHIQARGAGCRDERQRLAGGRVWKKPRWTAFHAGRGGGERVRQRGDTAKNGYCWGAVGGRNEQITTHNQLRQVGGEG